MNVLYLTSILTFDLALILVSGAQIPFHAPDNIPGATAERHSFNAAPAPAQRWDFEKGPSPNATPNYIFETVSSLLQQWPNTRYRNGHTVVPVTIPVGTLLYHGTRRHEIPSTPDWVATDPEHSFLFCRTMDPGDDSGCWMLSLAVMRPLKVLYFDGSSAAKIEGALDVQDILVWGETTPERLFDEMTRIRDLCEWGKKYDLDGFLRMEPDFEIMLCDFTAGVEVSSFLNIVSASGRVHNPPPRPATPLRRGGDMNLMPSFRALEAGHAHNRFPGETRAQLDLTRLITFYDTELFPSLVESRHGQLRYDHRVQKLGTEGRRRLLDRLDDVLAGEQQPGSGVDWISLTRVIVHRYAERLEILQYMLNRTWSVSSDDAIEKHVEEAHLYANSMLYPYILNKVVPDPNDTSSFDWASPIFEQCAIAHAKTIRTTLLPDLTSSERVILSAVEGVTHEICRVLVGIWAEGTMLRAVPTHSLNARSLHDVAQVWRTKINALLRWLDWSVWARCKPECSFEETCYLPTWPWLHGAEWPQRPRKPPGGVYISSEPTHTMKRDRRWGWVTDFSSLSKDDEDYWRRPQPKCIRRVFPLEPL